jgi:hypothetical protein
MPCFSDSPFRFYAPGSRAGGGALVPRRQANDWRRLAAGPALRKNIASLIDAYRYGMVDSYGTPDPKLAKPHAEMRPIPLTCTGVDVGSVAISSTAVGV